VARRRGPAELHQHGGRLEPDGDRRKQRSADQRGAQSLVGYLRIAGNDPDETDAGLRSVDITAGLKARLVF
jgi:hypothetical protein